MVAEAESQTLSDSVVVEMLSRSVGPSSGVTLA